MSKQTETSVLAYSRIAGFAYVATIVLGIVGVNLIASNLIVPGDDPATVKNIIENGLLFRVGIATEVLMYVLVVLLSFALYVALKTVNRNLALLALLWRLAEAIVGGATTVVSGLIPLLLISSETPFQPEQVQYLIGLFLNVRSAGLDVVLIFIGMGGTLFFYLFFKSRYIPRPLAVWGMLTYIVMLVLSFVSILVPNISESTKLIFYAPGGLFEIVVGLWLLVKGIDIEQWKKYS
ncbi:MAG: hypothetical protein AMJ68_04560 [Acidithiobacillales bacterium SG8_45]|nr:MAG: hypothetical protein AMJ68_04560 [Acidithiobacillales bacterium SG8_45]